MKKLFLVGLVVLLLIISPVAADVCNPIPNTNFCTVPGTISHTYNGIPFTFTIINEVPNYLLVTSPGVTDTLQMNGYKATKIHFLEHAGVAPYTPNGYNAGKIVVYYQDGTFDSVDLIIGLNTAELHYDRPDLQSVLAHSKIPPAYSYLMSNSWYPIQYGTSSFYGHFFYTSIDTAPKPIERIELQNTASVVWLAIDAITFESAQNQPPIANAGPDQTGIVGTMVTLDGSGSSDPDNNLPLTYAWIMSAPSGSTATLSSTTAAKPTFTPDKNGDYVITLTLKDSLGLQSTVADSVTITVTNQPLVADFEIYPKDDPTTTNYKPAGNTIPMVGGVIRFDARKSTGDIAKYRWDLGDNKGILETYEPIVEHIYREEKTYKVKLEIIDKNGNIAKKKMDFTIPKLQPGDIIFCNTKGYGGLIPGFYTHTGIYVGNGKIVETVATSGHGLPANGVGMSDIRTWSYPKETAVAVYRPMINDKYIKNAVKEANGFVRQRPHIMYDFAFVQKSQQPDAFYCSELVWAAYSLGSGGAGHWARGGLIWIDTYGKINLGYIPSPLGVTPSDIAADPRLRYVASHWEDEPGSPS